MNQEKQKGWWGRNWKWFVPVGCLGMLAIAVGVIFLLISFVFGIMKSTDPYKQALDRARGNTAVVEVMGSPIKEGFSVTGNVNVSGSTGTASFAIPISGPKGKATIYVEGTKSGGSWNYTTLEVVTASGETISLL